jgi:hypothetical protein
MGIADQSAQMEKFIARDFIFVVTSQLTAAIAEAVVMLVLLESTAKIACASVIATLRVCRDKLAAEPSSKIIVQILKPIRTIAVDAKRNAMILDKHVSMENVFCNAFLLVPEEPHAVMGNALIF